MNEYIFDRPDITIGYSYRVLIDLQSDPETVYFPTGCRLKLQMRRQVADIEPLVTLTTENGGITRITDTCIRVALTASQTGQFPEGDVSFDIVRTDVDPVAYIGIKMTLGVSQPYTRG